MDGVNWKQVLQGTLDDLRLTRSERRAFKQLLAPVLGDENRLHQIRGLAFELVREQITPENKSEILEWLEDIIRTTQEPTSSAKVAEAWFSPDPACVGRIEQAFREARRSVDICVFTITDDRLTRAILEAHQRGVRMRLITDDEKRLDAGSDIDELMRNSIAVRMDRNPDHMHHKYALFDGGLLLTGSYNWTRSAAHANEDNFLLTDDPRLVAAFQRHFDRTWDAFA
ncbi:MAG: phospholipase D-like domain-containing protein [Pirellulaceae bacterium]